jgi:hypothetical protein
MGANSMEKCIWNLKIGQRFITTQGILCEVVTPTQDGIGLLSRYLEGELKGQVDFIFESEIDFMSGPVF